MKTRRFGRKTGKSLKKQGKPINWKKNVISLRILRVSKDLVQKLREFIAKLDGNCQENGESLLLYDEIIGENNKIRKILKNFSVFLSKFLENTPIVKKASAKNAKNPRFSLTNLEKTKKNNMNILKNLYQEYNKLLKTHENLREIEEIEHETQTISSKIKEVSQSIHQENLIKNSHSKDLTALELLGFPLKKREFQRNERELQRIQLQNQALSSKLRKTEEKIDSTLGKYDEIKEKYEKHMIVARNMRVNLDENLMERYKSVQTRIKSEANGILICNRRDEQCYKSSVRKKAQLLEDCNEIEEKIKEITARIKEQNRFIEENRNNEQIKEILQRNIEPTRLFLEKPFRKHAKRKIVEKKLERKPMSLVNLSRNHKENQESFTNNPHYYSIEKTTTKIKLSQETNAVFSVPFSMKKNKEKARFFSQNQEKTEENTGKLEKNEENQLSFGKNTEDFTIKSGNSEKKQENIFPTEIKEEITSKNNENTNKKTFNFHQKKPNFPSEVTEKEEKPNNSFKEDKKNPIIPEIDEKYKEKLISPANNSSKIQEQRVWTQTQENPPEKTQNPSNFTVKKEEKPVVSNNITQETPFGPRKMFNFNQKKVTEPPNEKDFTNKTTNFHGNFEKSSLQTQKKEPAKNIFDSDTEKFFNIREIKEIDDKSTRIYSNSGLENSNEISNNNKITEKNDDNLNKMDEFANKTEHKKKQFKINQDKTEGKELNFEGKNTFFEDFELN